MHIEEQRKGDALVLSLSGRLDNFAAQEFVKVITRHIESDEHRIVINFAELSYLSSSGLRVLLGASKRIQKKQGDLFLCSLTGLVRRVIEIAGFHKILTIYDNEEEALQHF